MCGEWIELIFDRNPAKRSLRSRARSIIFEWSDFGFWYGSVGELYVTWKVTYVVLEWIKTVLCASRLATAGADPPPPVGLSSWLPACNVYLLYDKFLYAWWMGRSKVYPQKFWGDSVSWKKVTEVGFEPVTLDGPGGEPPGPTTLCGGPHTLIIKLKAMSNWISPSMLYFWKIEIDLKLFK